MAYVISGYRGARLSVKCDSKGNSFGSVGMSSSNWRWISGATGGAALAPTSRHGRWVSGKPDRHGNIPQVFEPGDFPMVSRTCRYDRRLKSFWDKTHDDGKRTVSWDLDGEPVKRKKTRHKRRKPRAKTLRGEIKPGVYVHKDGTVHYA